MPKDYTAHTWSKLNLTLTYTLTHIQYTHLLEHFCWQQGFNGKLPPTVTAIFFEELCYVGHCVSAEARDMENVQ